MALIHKFMYAFPAAHVILTGILMAPLVLLANLVPYFGDLWYASQFALVSWVFKSLSGAGADKRSKLFAPLHETTASRTASRPLDMLEIGPGTGSNFAFYPPNVRLTTWERNGFLSAQAQQLKHKFKDITFVQMLTGDAENMTSVPDASFDVVVTTDVICCTHSPKRLAKEILRVLKPVGLSLSLSLDLEDVAMIVMQLLP